MDPVRALLVAFVGLVIGTLAGFFGVGGGFLLTPTLNVLGFPMVTAIGTSFAAIAGNSTVGVLRHRRLGNVAPKLGVIIGLISIAGVEIGKRLVLGVEGWGLAGTYVRVGYIGLLSFISIWMLVGFFRRHRDKRRGTTEAQDAPRGKFRSFALPPVITFPRSEVPSVSLWVVVLSGLGIGFISGFMGVGGGFVAFPLLVYLIGVPTRTAVGTSLLITLFSSSYGIAIYGLAGRVQWLMALVVLGGAVLGVQVGARATRSVKGARIRVLFALLLLAVTVSVLLKQMGSPDVSLYLLLISASLLASVIWSFLIIGLLRGRKAPCSP
ncbi:MAG: sulfite exporter TauE/SafE family protein [Deltaproteobacteria bacterium]|nr:MAG: sulfite exporter TauE/SafE family protein [Deltaproteobacteria bacterium]